MTEATGTATPIAATMHLATLHLATLHLATMGANDATA